MENEDNNDRHKHSREKRISLTLNGINIFVVGRPRLNKQPMDIYRRTTEE